MNSFARMTLEELKAALVQINTQMETLEEREPSNESSKEHKDWEAECEALAVQSETVMTWIDRKMSEGLK